MHTSAEERFWRKVDKTGPIPQHRAELGPCWRWTGSLDTHGYGQIGVGPGATRLELAHRLAWKIQRGRIPPGLCVLHHCDNRSCVRGDHLFVGTKADNVADMVAKGRLVSPSGDRHGSRTRPDQVPRGERNGLAKLTPADVVSIRRQYASGASTPELGLAFGVHRATIRKIVVGLTWRHVPEN